ncbi:MAG: aminoacyl-tRNA hydrolase [Planctomycetota bacterium]
MPDDSIKLVVGLGNPGRRYDNTRHNVGFWVVDALAERWGATARPAHDGLLYDGRAERPGRLTQRVMLLKPQTFMNVSGRSVTAVMRYYKIAQDNVLLVLDDLALPPGRLRARPDGSAGGHKGLTDVQKCLGSDAVSRLRIGIGAPPEPMSAEDYVLATIEPDQRAVIDRAAALAADAVGDWLFEGITYVMDRYNRQPEDESADVSAE